jgi:hypothetical protein
MGMGALRGFELDEIPREGSLCTLRDRVSDQPVAFAELKIFEPQCKSLGPPQATANENRE